MNEQEILKLVASVVEKRNAAQVDSWDKTPYEKRKYPKYYNGYEQIVKEYERIETHAKFGEFPERLFLKRSPNQTKEEFEYEKENYKQTTLPIFIDFVNTISRIFSDGNWSISFDTENDKYRSINATLQEYLEIPLSDYGSVEEFVKTLLPAQILRDANGVIAVRPDENKTSYDDNGIEIIDNSVLPEPKIFYFECEDVVAKDANEFYLLQSENKSDVYYGNRSINKGLIYEFYDRNSIWIIKQIGNYTDFKFEATLLLQHNMDYLTAFTLGGIPIIEDGAVIYQSPFLYACDSLDLVALNQSRLQISTNTSVYPYKVMIGTPCDFEFKGSDGTISPCANGRIYNTDLTQYGQCPQCNGSGLKSRMSPMGVLLLNPTTREGEGDAKMSQDPLRYISPEVTTLEFLREQCRIDDTRARNILHLRTTNTQATGPQGTSATGDTLDMKAMYSFIKPISDLCFSKYERLIDSIGKLRYGNDYIKPSLSYPVTFDFMTESDYINQITAATQAGAPAFLIQAIMYKFLKALYYNEATTARAFDLIYHTDRLIAMSANAISIGLSKGTVSDWEVVLHDSGIFFVNELFMNNPKFFDQDFLSQQQQLIEASKLKAQETKPAPIDIQAQILALGK